ncbi:MAG: HAMP domain-containing histidine kinase [Elusimicrobia bacterium]|nr:HAMP domain-containing histidine kinase [Elusimicrobiota bacterium]
MGRLIYLLTVLPFVTDFIKTDRWWTGAVPLVVNAALAGTIGVILFLLRRARRRELLIDNLRKTMNEAIIHDLKNPMTSIMGCLSCLIHDPPDAEHQRKLLRLAQHSCKSQMALLETLVDTSRMEQGELVAQKAPIDVRQLLEDILDDARGAASYLDITLNESIAKDAPADLYADSELLRRVLANLIHNALKYTPRDGSVSLDISFDDKSFRFAISDTGIGIAGKHLGKLFGKYYRVEGGDQTTRRGSGLGLYFCRLAVEAHGGTIRVTSEADKGTRIDFNIPRALKREHPQ